MNNIPKKDGKIVLIKKETSKDKYIEKFFKDFSEIKEKSEKKNENKKFHKWLNSYTYNEEYKVKSRSYRSRSGLLSS